MEDLLREFLELALEEMRNARVLNQLRSSKPKKPNSSDADDKKVEMSTVATALVPGGGYTAPLGSSSADMKSGKHATKVKKRKKDYVRIK